MMLQLRNPPNTTGDHRLYALKAALEAVDGLHITIPIEIEIQMVGGATLAASLYMSTITRVYGITSFGVTSVRYIAGTSTWSQHAYGNAVDTMCAGDLLRNIAFFVDANRGALRIAHLLADPFFPSPLGDHYNHVHADFYPQYGGTPPGHPI